MSDIDEKRLIAKIAFDAFGGKPSVIRYWDDAKVSSIDILICKDRPEKDVVSYSTVGLSNYTIGFSVKDKLLNVELVGASYSKFDIYSNILATCAFNIINSKYTCYPGAIFQNVINLYDLNLSMKHILFVHPFLWEDQLKTLNLMDKQVAWLLAVPISNEEFIYAKENGTDALEDLFVENEIDIFDLARKNIINIE